MNKPDIERLKKILLTWAAVEEQIEKQGIIIRHTNDRFKAFRLFGGILFGCLAEFRSAVWQQSIR